MKRLFAPLSLPFKVPKLFDIPYYIQAFLVGAIRLTIAILLGPEAYFISRLRIGMAISVFLIKMVFALFKQDATGRQWMLYLAIAAEIVQIGMSLYVGYRLANATPTIEVVEQIDLVDKQGRLITTYEKKVSPQDL